MLAARLLLLSFLIVAAAAEDVRLSAPLTTIVTAPGEVRGGSGATVRARVSVPADAPADLGVGAWATDRHGRWYQRLEPGVLKPGTQAMVSIELGERDAVQAEGHGGEWNAAEAGKTARAGLFFWSASASRARLRIDDLRADAAPESRPRDQRLLDLRVDGIDAAGLAPSATGVAHGATGERWAVEVTPEPFPENPYDRGEFSLELVVTSPEGHEERVPGFFLQPMRASDRGDRERVVPDGAARFAARYRPRQPGSYRMRLEAKWKDGRSFSAGLPDLVVSGKPWDGFMRVDHDDSRFFAVDGKWFWPIGPNLRSVWDLRCQQYLGTKVTPDRGTISYRAYLDRLAAAGVDAIEVWMCSWNLALEWRGDWPGYFGRGRYNEENAWRLDQLLDDAWARGIRVNLVVYNHGQASDRTDREWDNNPYSTAQGGKLRDAADYFTDPGALAAQERLRTYLVARYADHPALLAWKLWSEINLTGAARSEDTLRAWHEQATARWHALDIYGHPCTTHWAGDFRSPHRSIVALPGIDFVCIDAYHAPEGEGGGMLLADLLMLSTGSGERRGGGLSRYGKPVLVTEYGGSWNACPPPQMEAEHASGAFAALVTGHAGAPMLWWFEWIDQGNRFAPYRAISRFIAGEDLRNPAAASVALQGVSAAGDLWVRAWSRPGRMLGYALDRAWGAHGIHGDAVHDHAQISTAATVAPGRMVVEWWNADTGERISSASIDHQGGALTLEPPAFQRHIAFKLYRVTDQ